jgi:hypothetical protein
MPRVNCKHFLGCCVRRDPDTEEPVGWVVDCDIHGNEQEIGYDCGKGCCKSYSPKSKEGGTDEH